jgi:hypothetical protein
LVLNATFSIATPLVLPFRQPADFSVAQYSPSGAGTVTLYNVSGSGCNTTDYAAVPAGAAAVVKQSHDCKVRDQQTAAFNSGVNIALLIICSYDEASGSSLKTRGNMTLFSNSTTPVLLGSSSVGAYLQMAMLAGAATVSFNVQTKVTDAACFNVIADSLEGDPANTIVIAGHLDSVPAGPGINDDGSGTATVLEIARQIALRLYPLKYRVRFAWWGAEEIGLVGSQYYVDNLKATNTTELGLLRLMLDLDMLASPNYIRGIYNGSSGPAIVAAGSGLIQERFQAAFDLADLSWVLGEFDGRSDYGPFIENGVPAGGIYAGAEVIKTEPMRELFGGLNGAQFDPCYHLACDTINNINVEVLEQMANAASQVLQDFATTDMYMNQLISFLPQHNATR